MAEPRIYRNLPSNDGAQKRMRKGTKSCLACRQRKVRCTLQASDAGQLAGAPTTSSCNECAKHGYSCIPQGLVDDSKNDPEAKRPRKLKERVAQLEGLVERLGPLMHFADLDQSRLLSLSPTTSRTVNGPISNGSFGYTPISRSVSGTQASVSSGVDLGESSTLEQSTTAETVASDDSFEQVASDMAPLIRLLKNPVLGCSSVRALQDTQSSQPSRQVQSSVKYHKIMQHLSAAVPTPEELSDILRYQSGWWTFYRSASDLIWGSSSTLTLKDLATDALTGDDPALLGLLLVCLAISTGNNRRYLPSVEKGIVEVDELAGSEHGLSCLMALGLCYIGALQPRRAWLIYRRANTLMQLNGQHITHRKSPSIESVFWQLFHGDRWVSLMIGLPYCIHERFCDVHIDPLEVLGPSRWFYRHLALCTGRVIEHLQTPQNSSLTLALEIEEQLESLAGQLPVKYLDITEIRRCLSREEQFTRLYRRIHFHLLKAYVHLPFLLRSAGNEQRYGYSRQCCLHDSRCLLEGYLELFDLDPNAASDGTVLNFNASFAATVLLLGLLGYGKPGCSFAETSERNDVDWTVIRRTMDAIKEGAKGRAGALCKRSHEALSTLVASATTPKGDGPTRITIPYFGTIEVKKGVQFRNPSNASAAISPTAQNSTMATSMPETTVTGEQCSEQHQDFSTVLKALTAPNNMIDDLLLEYHGPYMTDGLDIISWANDDMFTWNDTWHDAGLET